MLYAKKKKKKLNKLNKNQWFIKMGGKKQRNIRSWRPGGARVCECVSVWRLRGSRQSGTSASLRYIFGAAHPGLLRVRSGAAGLRLLRDGDLILLQAAPASLVQPHVAQHGLGEARVREAGPLGEQRLHHVGHEACRVDGAECQSQSRFTVYIFPNCETTLFFR